MKTMKKPSMSSVIRSLADKNPDITPAKMREVLLAEHKLKPSDALISKVLYTRVKRRKYVRKNDNGDVTFADLQAAKVFADKMDGIAHARNAIVSLANLLN